MSPGVTLTSLGSFVGRSSICHSAGHQSPWVGACRKGPQPCGGEDRVRLLAPTHQALSLLGGTFGAVFLLSIGL